MSGASTPSTLACCIAFQCDVLKAFRYATGMTLAVYLKCVKVRPKIAHTEGVMDTLPKKLMGSTL
jgi:hypothetical protein